MPTKSLTVEGDKVYMLRIFILGILVSIMTALGSIAVQRRVAPREEQQSAATAPAVSSTDAVQFERLQQLARDQQRIEQRLDIIEHNVDLTAHVVDRIMAIGVGFGSLLSVLVSLDVLLRSRERHKARP